MSDEQIIFKKHIRQANNISDKQKIFKKYVRQVNNL